MQPGGCTRAGIQPRGLGAIHCIAEARSPAREQARLGQILEALKRMEGGTYGTCVVCGEPVTFERLRVFPEAPNCAACAGR